jgi:hypothetical protein
MKATTGVLCGLLLAATAAQADVPAPDGKRGPDPRFGSNQPLAAPLPALVAEGRRLTVSSDSRDGRVHVRIPRKLMAALQSQPAPPAPTTGGAPVNRTILAGVFLSAAIVTGGVWFLRYRRVPAHGGKVAVATCVLVASLGCVLFDRWGDSPRPPAPIPGAEASGYVDIEYVDEGDGITVQLPTEMADKVGRDAKKK